MTTFAASYPPRRKTRRNFASPAPGAAYARDTSSGRGLMAYAAPSKPSFNTLRRGMIIIVLRP
jgi:hypothetical protein